MRNHIQEQAAVPEPAAKSNEPRNDFDRGVPDCDAQSRAYPELSMDDAPVPREFGPGSTGAVDPTSHGGLQEGDQRAEVDERMQRAQLEAIVAAAHRAVPRNEAKRHRLMMTALHPNNECPPENKRFRLGQLDTMLDAAKTWSLRGFNVYVSLALFNAQRLAARGPRARGTTEDASRILGLGSDLDLDHGQDVSAVERFKVAPTFVLETSRSAAGPNRQALFLFQSAISPADAKPLAKSLQRSVADKDGATGDIVHVWRVAGCPNHISMTKAQRRGLPWPCKSQLVRIDDELSSRQEVSYEALAAFLEVELEGYDHAEAERLQGYEPQPHKADRDGLLKFDRDIWSGHEGDRRRVVDAFRAFDRHHLWTSRRPGAGIMLYGQNWNIRDYGTYIRAGFALHVFFGGHEIGFKLWRDVSAGYNGFQGARDRWDEETARKHWASFREPDSAEFLHGRFITISTFLQIAGTCCGFDLRRSRYGLQPLSRFLSKPCPEALAVIEAGKSFHGLAEVPDRNGMMRDLRNQAIDALRRHIDASVGARSRIKTVFNLLARDLHGGSDPRLPVGVGFRSGLRIRKMLSDMGQASWSKDDLRDELQALAALRVIVYSPGHKVGAHGRKGLSYALTPPAGHTWETLIEAFRQDLGHGARTAKVNKKGTPPEGGMPPRTEKGVPSSQSGMSALHSPTDSSMYDLSPSSAPPTGTTSQTGSAPDSRVNPKQQPPRPEGSSAPRTLDQTVAELKAWAETVEVLPDDLGPSNLLPSPTSLVLACLPGSHKRVSTLRRLLGEAAGLGASLDQIRLAVESAWYGQSRRDVWSEMCRETPSKALAALTYGIVRRLGEDYGLSSWPAYQEMKAAHLRRMNHSQHSGSAAARPRKTPEPSPSAQTSKPTPTDGSASLQTSP